MSLIAIGSPALVGFFELGADWSTIVLLALCGTLVLSVSLRRARRPPAGREDHAPRPRAVPIPGSGWDGEALPAVAAPAACPECGSELSGDARRGLCPR